MSKLPHREFPPSVIHKLFSYVYGLLDPRTEPPTLFYIGKGKGNRVFAHAADALVDPTDSDKLELIREILEKHEVQSVILRHGLSDGAAFDVECALIDLCRHFLHVNLTNVQGGHRSDAFGVMTTDETIRKYEAQPLEVLEPDCVLININNSYRRAKGAKSYYEATRGDWKMDKVRHPFLKYALSEYRGFIVEVFAISKWSETVVKDKSGKERKRWRFEGTVAPDEVRNLYLNRSIQKKKGAAFPLRYKYLAE